MAVIPASEFKAKCLDLMDRVAERRETYVITKRGKPVAKLVPADRPRERKVFGCMADQTAFVGDLDEPAWSEDEWKEFEHQRLEQAKVSEREWQRHGTVSGKKTVGEPPRLVKHRTAQGRGRRGSAR